MSRIRGHTIVVWFGVAAALFFLNRAASGQFTTVLDLPPDPNIGDDQSIGSDTQVSIHDGGFVGERFQVGATDGSSTNIEVNLSGGQIGGALKAYGGSVFNVSGGTIGVSADAFAGSVFNFSGGVVDRDFEARSGSQINVSGGTFRASFIAQAGSAVDISGGEFGGIRLHTPSMTVSGGDLEKLDAFSGSGSTITGGGFFTLRSYAGSSLDFTGGEFLLDGASVSGAVDIPSGSVLSGTLSDGSVFIISRGLVTTLLLELSP